jgi:hypothetical protein
MACRLSMTSCWSPRGGAAWREWDGINAGELEGGSGAVRRGEGTDGAREGLPDVRELVVAVAVAVALDKVVDGGVGICGNNCELAFGGVL